MWVWPKGLCPGVETPVTPDEPDVLDGGDVVEGDPPLKLLILFAESTQLHSAKTAKMGFVSFGIIRIVCFPE